MFRTMPVTMWLIALSLAAILAFVISPRHVLAFVAGDPRQYPWTLLTYPFLTVMNPLGWAFMMAVLWWVGGQMESFWGSRKLLVAWLTISALHDLVTLVCTGRPEIGMTLPLGSLCVAWTVLNPRAQIMLMLIIPVSGVIFRYITLVGMFLWSGLSGNPLSGVAAVLVGLAAGYWTAVTPARQLWPGRPRRARGSKSKARLKLVEKPPPQGSVLAPVPELTSALEKDIDRILDKIRVDGIGALTPEERRTLDEHSVRLRKSD